MLPISQEQFNKRFQALPEVLQDAIFSEKTADTIGQACQLRDVDESVVSLVATLAGRVLLGFLRPEEFASEIQKETGVDAMKATQVAGDLDREIFSNVRLELKKLYPPLIYTPTVQAPGFMKSQAPAPEPQRPAPSYVVPIPEKFRAQGVFGSTSSPQVTQPNPPAQSEEKLISAPSTPLKISEFPKPTPPPAKPAPLEAGERYEPSRPLTGPATPPRQKASTFVPTTKPIVPLPTFIQSKFKEETMEQKKSAADGKNAAEEKAGKPEPRKESFLGKLAKPIMKKD